MDEIPRYRKKKTQTSKSSKRADHKHEYEKTITAVQGRKAVGFVSWNWSTHCKICGRPGDFIINNDDFRKPEYKGRRLFHAAKMFLSPHEILKKYPEFPVYINSDVDPFDLHRMTDAERRFWTYEDKAE